MRAGVAAPPLSLSHLQAGPQGVDVLHGGREEAWAECGPAPRQPSSRTQRAAKKKKECAKGERGGGGAAGKPLSPSRLDKNAHALSSRESLRLPSHTFHTRTHAHAHHGCWLAPILGAGERERERAGNREREGGTARARPPPPPPRRGEQQKSLGECGAGRPPVPTPALLPPVHAPMRVRTDSRALPGCVRGAGRGRRPRPAGHPPGDSHPTRGLLRQRGMPRRLAHAPRPRRPAPPLSPSLHPPHLSIRRLAKSSTWTWTRPSSPPATPGAWP